MIIEEIARLAKEEIEKNTKRCIIVSGGKIQREYALRVLQEKKYAYLICADAGLQFLYDEEIEPTHIVGDFDSLRPQILEKFMNNPNVTVRMFNPVKDQTDTEIAIGLAMELECTEIWILGGTGGRIDHTVGNIQSMMEPLKRGITAVLADEQNEIRLITGICIVTKEGAQGRYLSLLPFGGPVEDLSVTGVKYPLSHYRMEPVNSLGVSNEVTEDKAVIKVAGGVVMMILSKDLQEGV